jgi:hypothetical protein
MNDYGYNGTLMIWQNFWWYGKSEGTKDSNCTLDMCPQCHHDNLLSVCQIQKYINK